MWDHNYIGHGYMGHNYIGQNYTDFIIVDTTVGIAEVYGATTTWASAIQAMATQAVSI